MVGSLETSGQSTCSGFLPGFLPGFFPFDSHAYRNHTNRTKIHWEGNSPKRARGKSELGGRVPKKMSWKDESGGRIGIMRKEERAARGLSQKNQSRPEEDTVVKA